MFHATVIVVLLVINIIISNAQQNYSCNRTAACGCSRNPAVLTRILGGETAPNSTWGWAAILYLNQSFYCGATVISASWVLSTKACVGIYVAPQIEVYAGGQTFFFQQQVRSVSEIIFYPNNNNDTLTNSIALLRLSTPFNMSDPFISQICLPSSSRSDYPPMNAPLVIVGWGRVNGTSGSSRSLQQATLEQMPANTSTCSSVVINSSVLFCAAAFNYSKGPCSGDIGGPLMMFTSSRQWVLAGIQARNFGCSNTGSPSIYLRVTPYLDWMRSLNVTGTVSADIDDANATFTTTLPTTTTQVTTTPTTATTSTTTTRQISTVSTTMRQSVTNTTRRSNANAFGQEEYWVLMWIMPLMVSILLQ